MTITNPTGDSITVQIKGEVYTLPANGSLKNLPKSVVDYWTKSLHTFLTVSEDKSDKEEVEKLDKVSKTK